MQKKGKKKVNLYTFNVLQYILADKQPQKSSVSDLIEYVKLWIFIKEDA